MRRRGLSARRNGLGHLSGRRPRAARDADCLLYTGRRAVAQRLRPSRQLLLQQPVEPRRHCELAADSLLPMIARQRPRRHQGLKRTLRRRRRGSREGFHRASGLCRRRQASRSRSDLEIIEVAWRNARSFIAARPVESKSRRARIPPGLLGCATNPVRELGRRKSQPLSLASAIGQRRVREKAIAAPCGSGSSFLVPPPHICCLPGVQYGRLIEAGEI